MATTSTVHRILLALSATLLGVLGLLYTTVPGVMLDLAGVEADVAVSGMLRLAGSAVLGEACAVVLALRSGQPAAVRVVSLMLVVHFTVETVVRIVSYSVGESTVIATALPQALLALGLGICVARSRDRAPEPTGLEAGAAR